MKKVLIFLLLNILLINNVFASEKIEVKYSDCVDGDTIKVIINGEKTTVRLLAVDTPETVHPTKEVESFGKEANDFTCNKIKNAKKIELEYDEASTKADKYGRHLAWVFIDDKLLQEELIKKGYAKIDYLYGDYKYTEKLQKIESDVKDEKIGVWSSEEYINKTEESDGKTNTIKYKIYEIISNAISDLIDSVIKEITKGIKSLFN